MKNIKWILEFIYMNIGLFLITVIEKNVVEYVRYISSLTLVMAVVKGVVYIIVVYLCYDILKRRERKNKVPLYLMWLEAVLLIFNAGLFYWLGGTGYGSKAFPCSEEFMILGCILFGFLSGLQIRNRVRKINHRNNRKFFII